MKNITISDAVKRCFLKQDLYVDSQAVYERLLHVGQDSETYHKLSKYVHNSGMPDTGVPRYIHIDGDDVLFCFSNVLNILDDTTFAVEETDAVK